MCLEPYNTVDSPWKRPNCSRVLVQKGSQQLRFVTVYILLGFCMSLILLSPYYLFLFILELTEIEYDVVAFFFFFKSTNNFYLHVNWIKADTIFKEINVFVRWLFRSNGRWQRNSTIFMDILCTWARYHYLMSLWFLVNLEDRTVTG